MTEASETEVPETPQADRSEIMDSSGFYSPETPAHVSASPRRSGKGTLTRSTTFENPVDRVRKRPRNNRDRDIGSTRKRLPGGCDEDDSDYETYASRQSKHRTAPENMGWLYYILSTVSSNPEAPIVFSWYLQVFVNAFFGGLLLWVAWGIISAVRGEVIYSSEKAKLNLLAEIEHCSKQYAANRCSPIAERIPAVEGLCNEWDQCMSQDPNSVAGVKASVSHLADIVNEFTTRLSWKSIVSIDQVCILQRELTKTVTSVSSSCLLWSSYLRTTWPSASFAKMCATLTSITLANRNIRRKTAWDFP